MYHINFIYLQGHGGLYQKEPCLIIPDHKTKGKLRILNVSNLAKEYAKIDKCITIIFFDACRENLDNDDFKGIFSNAVQDLPLFQYEPRKVPFVSKGFSAIVYSCKEWEKAVESINSQLTYAKQEKGHTFGAKCLFSAFS